MALGKTGSCDWTVALACADRCNEALSLMSVGCTLLTGSVTRDTVGRAVVVVVISASSSADDSSAGEHSRLSTVRTS